MLTSKRISGLGLGAALALGIGLGLSGSAHAQAPGGGGGAPGQLGPGGAPASGEEGDKEAGIAEKAPEDSGLTVAPIPNLPPFPGEKQKGFQLLTIDGYFRFRAEWMKNFHLGFNDLGSGTPFPRALSCLDGANAASTTCSRTVSTTNMRLRLEPTVHLSERVALHTQLDVFDNFVLGSTTEGVFIDGSRPNAGDPIDAFGQSQSDPQAGKNALYDSIRFKRVWAEIDTPLGLLKFGRMPTQFGLGIRDNAGSGMDDDYGDTVDRVSFSRDIPGTPLLVSLAVDWSGMGPTSDRLNPRQDGQAYDIDDADDTAQYVFTLSRMDDPAVWKDNLDQGKLGFNWGFNFTYRKQDWQLRDDGSVSPSPALNQQFQPRGAHMYIPDAFARVAHGKWNVEAEAVAVIGHIENVSDVDTDATTDGVQGTTGAVKLRQYGWVVRSSLQALPELGLGLEIGSASGDEWDATKQGEVNYRDVPALPRSPVDGSASAFLFDPSYQVDFILFKQLLGTVRNATYVKPSLTWDIVGKLQLRGWAVVSFANKPIATPGNSSMWGVEMDADLGYHNDEEGFFAGLSYGFLIPLGAMDHPADLFPNTAEQGDAGNAQTIRLRLAIKF